MRAGEGKRTNLTVRVDEEFAARVARAAGVAGMSVSRLTRLAVELYVQSLLVHAPGEEDAA